MVERDSGLMHDSTHEETSSDCLQGLRHVFVIPGTIVLRADGSRPSLSKWLFAVLE